MRFAFRHHRHRGYWDYGYDRDWYGDGYYGDYFDAGYYSPWNDTQSRIWAMQSAYGD